MANENRDTRFAITQIAGFETLPLKRFEYINLFSSRIFVDTDLPQTDERHGRPSNGCIGGYQQQGVQRRRGVLVFSGVHYAMIFVICISFISITSIISIIGITCGNDRHRPRRRNTFCGLRLSISKPTPSRSRLCVRLIKYLQSRAWFRSAR